VHFIDENLLLHETQGIILVFSRQSPSASGVRAIETMLLPHTRRYPNNLGLLLVAHADRDNGAPDEATRDAFLGMGRRIGPHLGAVAVVVLREGFVGASIRAVVSGMLMALAPRFPARSFGSNPEALRWLAATLSRTRAQSVDEAALATSLADVQRTMLAER
jgi:hypothetical protein